MYGMDVIVERSGNHCHLNRETFKSLFGYDIPQVSKKLVNANYFVCKEKVNFNGYTLPILGPLREYNQIELARSTDIARDWPSAYSAEDRYSQEVVLFDSECSQSFAVTNAICIVSLPHVHIPSSVKKLLYCTVSFFSTKTRLEGIPMFCDPTITVKSLHLDNDWYNAINARNAIITTIDDAESRVVSINDNVEYMCGVA